MALYQGNKYRSDKELRQMNEARSGSLLDFIDDLPSAFPACIDEYETLLTDNRIWKQRLVDVGIVTLNVLWHWALLVLCCVVLGSSGCA